MSDTPQQLINTGQVVNDGTGESLRNAFTAVNNNFANIWAAGPVDSQVVISNNRISTSETNLDIILAGNGIGNIQLASTTIPSIANVYDIGSNTAPFSEIHGQYFYGNGRFLTGISGGSGGGTVYFQPSAPLNSNIGDVWIESDTGTQYIYFNDIVGNIWAEMEAYQSFSSGTSSSSTGNWDFVNNTMYNINGGTINNSDLTHGATAFISIPENGNSSPVALLNYYGNVLITTGDSPSVTKAWNFDKTGNITLPTNSSNINYANGVSILNNVSGSAQALLVGRALTPVTVPLSTANSFNVLTVASGNVAVYTT